MPEYQEVVFVGKQYQLVKNVALKILLNLSSLNPVYYHELLRERVNTELKHICKPTVQTLHMRKQIGIPGEGWCYSGCWRNTGGMQTTERKDWRRGQPIEVAQQRCEYGQNTTPSHGFDPSPAPCLHRCLAFQPLSLFRHLPLRQRPSLGLVLALPLAHVLRRHSSDP